MKKRFYSQRKQLPTALDQIWFHLYDFYTGKPYKGTSAYKVSLPPSANIAQFRDAVKLKYSDSHLKGIAPSDLLVFQNKDAFDKKAHLDLNLPLSAVEIKEHFIVTFEGKHASTSLIIGHGVADSSFIEFFNSEFSDFFKDIHGHDKGPTISGSAVIDREDFYKDVMEEITRRYYKRDGPKTFGDERSFNCLNFVWGGTGILIR